MPGIAVHDPGMGVHDARNGRSGWSGISVQDGPAHAPNKRLKLAGGDRFKGSGVLCPGGHELSFSHGCAGGRVARSLSASR